jgi:Ca2+-binding RTX toxin-like protein
METQTANSLGARGLITVGGAAAVDYTGVDQFVITGGSAADQLKGTEGDDLLAGGAGDDRLEGFGGDDRLIGGAGADLMDGGAGRDTVSYAGATSGVSILLKHTPNSDFSTNVDLTAAAGQALGDDYRSVEVFELSAHTDRFVVQDLTSTRSLVVHDGGAAGSDEIFTGAGNDTVYLTGGTHDATMGNKSVRMGTGTNDRLVLDYSNAQEAVILDAKAPPYADDHEGKSGVVWMGGYSTATAGFRGVDHFTITTGAKDDSIFTGHHQGGRGDDIVNAGAGNDDIRTGWGKDVVDGGDGIDRWNMDWSELTEDLSVDFTQSLVVKGSDGREARNVEAGEIVTGSGNDVVRLGHTDYTNVVQTGAGADTVYLDGRGARPQYGGDAISLGSGLDTLVADYTGATHGIEMSWTLDAEGHRGYIVHGTGTALSLSGADYFKITGSGHADKIVGGRFQDRLDGGAGNDQLSGGAGDDELIGGAGDDLLDAGTGDDRLDGGEGVDALKADWSALEQNLVLDLKTNTSNRQVSNVERLVDFRSGSGSDLIHLGDGALADVVDTGSNDDRVVTRSGATAATTGLDTIAMGEGFDTLVLDYSAATEALSQKNRTNVLDTVAGDITLGGQTRVAYSGVERFHVTGGSAADTIYAGLNNDTLFGGEGADRLFGENGDDALNGGAGNDMLWGGLGDDVLDGGDGNDVLYADGGLDKLIGGAGVDGVVADWSDYEDDLRIDFVAGVDLTLQDGRRMAQVERAHDLKTGARDDTVVLNGELENFINTGHGHDDVHVVGAGTTTAVQLIALGGGFNNLAFDYRAATVAVGVIGDAPTEGRFIIEGQTRAYFTDVGTLSVQAGSAGDHLQGLAGRMNLFYGGLGGDTLIGGEVNDHLHGQDGDDILQGRAGSDELHGGAGDDLLEGGVGYDHLDGGDGFDTASYADFQTGVTLDLRGGAASTEDLLANIERIAGSAHADVIRLGGAGLEVLAGDGDDQVFGGAGADTLSGGSGADALDGGAGDDTLFGNADADALSGQAGADKLLGGDGDDTLRGGSENDELLGGAGSDLLEGGLHDDLLNGGAGDDVLKGGDGEDTAVFGGSRADYTVTLSNGTVTLIQKNTGETDTVSGVEWFQFADQRMSLADLPSSGGGGGGGGEGDDLLSGTEAAENLDGRGGNDRLFGYGGADTLNGGDGNDVLIGGAGADLMIGGAGDDVYEFTDPGDVAVEAADGGTDVVFTHLHTTALGDHVETLSLQGGAVLGIGNAGANTIIGTNGDNVLVGGAGNDRLIGGLGNDTYEVTESGDAVFENPGEGNDTVYAYVNHGLAPNVETLILQGSAMVGVGNAGDNLIIGTAGNNVLVGGAGNDRLVGGLGDDSYEVTEAGDSVEEAAGGGNDTVFSYLHTYVLAANVETLSLQGSAVVGVGNAQANTLIGNAGANTLNGEGGNDRLIGGAGQDTFWFLAGGGSDRIADFNAADDTIVLDRSMWADFAEVQSTWAQVGSDVVITHASGATLTLEGMLLTQLGAADFGFYG